MRAISRSVLMPVLALSPLLAGCESSMRLPPFDNPFGGSERVVSRPVAPRIDPAPAPQIETAPLPSVQRQDLAPPPGVSANPQGNQGSMPNLPSIDPALPPIIDDPAKTAKLTTPTVPTPPPVAAPDTSRPTQSSVTGNWQAREASGTSCKVTLSSSAKLDLYGASTSGCQSKELQRVTAWELRGDDVYLYEPGGAVAARFKATGRRMDGALAKTGAPVSLSK